MMNPRAFLIAALLSLMGFSAALSQERIVSVGGDVTEIVYALGFGDRLVATDSTSVYPPAAVDTPKVGYVRNLAAEGVLSVEPDLVLISGAAGPPEVVEQLRASGVAIVEMETAYTIESIIEKTRVVAAALNAEAEGQTLLQQIEADWAQAQSVIDALALQPSALFFATLQDGAPRAAGTDTAAHGVITLIGGDNVFDAQSGYQALSLEAAVAANPDIILVMSHHAGRVGGLEGVTGHPAISLTEAASKGRIFLVDPVTMMQFGPRTPSAIAELAQSIHSGLEQSDDS